MTVHGSKTECWASYHTMEDKLSWHDTHPRFVEDYVDFMACCTPVAVSVCDGHSTTMCVWYEIYNMSFRLSRQFDHGLFPEGTTWAFDRTPSWVWQTINYAEFHHVFRKDNGSLCLRRKSDILLLHCGKCSDVRDAHWFFCRRCKLEICRVRHLPRCLMFTLVDGLLPDVVRLVCRRLMECTLLTNGQC